MAPIALLALVLAAAPTPPPPPPDTLARLAGLQSAARAAHDKGDFTAFLARTEEALALRPGSPRLLYNRACGLALTGQAARALAALEELAERQLDFDLSADPDLATLRSAPAWAALEARFAGLRRPQGEAEAAFVLPGPWLIEGLAHDPRTGRVFASSVRQRRLLVLSAEKGETRVADFVPRGRDGLLSPLALRADPVRRRLWVASAALPEGEGYAPDQAGRAELLAFDLDDGRLLERLAAPAAEEHNFNDLELDGDGGLFVSDAVSGQIWRLAAGAHALAELLPKGRLRSPQGLALSADGQALFVADYASGLWRLELATRVLTPVPAPERLVTLGIDGLLRDGGGLVAVQNGIRPHRVVRLTLSGDGRRVSTAEVLAMGLADLDEPTLAVRAGERLLVVGRSQWTQLGGGSGAPPGDLPPAVLLALRTR